MTTDDKPTKLVSHRTTKTLPCGTTVTTLHLTPEAKRGLSTNGVKIPAPDECKVFVEADGIVYRGRHSVNQSGGRVWIDGKLVGVEVDNNGNPLVASLPTASINQPSWPVRLWRWIRGAR